MFWILSILVLSASCSYSYNIPCLHTYWLLYNSYFDMSSYSEYVDLNGDGLVDFICAFQNTAGTEWKFFYLNTGCSLIDQGSFNSSSYCPTILQNDNYKHLRKLAYAKLDDKLSQHLSKSFNPEKIKIINNILAAEGIDYDTFFQLKYEHLIDMGLPLGDIFKLQKLQQ